MRRSRVKEGQGGGESIRKRVGKQQEEGWQAAGGGSTRRRVDVEEDKRR